MCFYCYDGCLCMCGYVDFGDDLNDVCGCVVYECYVVVVC